MLEAHVACFQEVSNLPRDIRKEDRTVKFDSRYQALFKQQYEKVFGYNIYIEENISKDVKKQKLKKALKSLFHKYGDEAKQKL